MAFVVICRRAAEPEPEAHYNKVVHVSAPAVPHGHEVPHAHHEVPLSHHASVAHVQHTVEAHPAHHTYYKGKADAEGAVQMMEQMMGPIMNMH